jgi:hypothetical protein
MTLGILDDVRNPGDDWRFQTAAAQGACHALNLSTRAGVLRGISYKKLQMAHLLGRQAFYKSGHCTKSSDRFLAHFGPCIQTRR